MTYSASGKPIEVDVYIPSLSLAFEFQGEQHFATGNEEKGFFHDLGYRQLKDEEKRSACKKLGLTLIEVPYWWDKTVEALTTLISSVRPDISEKFHKG